jgi:hypothetical protein
MAQNGVARPLNARHYSLTIPVIFGLFWSIFLDESAADLARGRGSLGNKWPRSLIKQSI